MNDLTIGEKLLGFAMAVGTFVWGWAASMGKLHTRVSAVEKENTRLDKEHARLDKQHVEIQQSIYSLRIEIRNEMSGIADRAEERHTRLEDKIDRLIERGKPS